MHIDIPHRSSTDIPPDDRPKEFVWGFRNSGEYIIKWYKGPASPRVLDVAMPEDTENATEGTLSSLFELF